MMQKNKYLVYFFFSAINKINADHKSLIIYDLLTAVCLSSIFKINLTDGNNL